MRQGKGLAALDASLKSPECLQESKPFRVDKEKCLVGFLTKRVFYYVEFPEKSVWCQEGDQGQ